MDWERYTGKKSKPVGPAGVNTLSLEKRNDEWRIITLPTERVDDHTVRIVETNPGAFGPVTIGVPDELVDNVCGEHPSYPSFDEVWESVKHEIWNTIPESAPMNGRTIEAVLKIAMRIMYEALTEAQDKP